MFCQSSALRHEKCFQECAGQIKLKIEFINSWGLSLVCWLKRTQKHVQMLHWQHFACFPPNHFTNLFSIASFQNLQCPYAYLPYIKHIGVTALIKLPLSM